MRIPSELDWITTSLLLPAIVGLLSSCSDRGEAAPESVASWEAPVIGGSDATPGEWPWQAQISVPSYSHWCGGSLLDDEWILTAGHCAEGRAASNFTVRLGVHQRSAPDGFVQVRSVSEVHIHPNFSAATLENDLALLRLSDPVTYTSRVQPISIRATDPAVGTAAFVTGWGNTFPGSGAADVLQEAILPVHDPTTCNNAGTLPGSVTNTMLCAGYVDGEAGGCHGDSGGPLVIQNGYSNGWEQVGVVSWGRATVCSTYTVFARLSQFTSWIGKYVSAEAIYGDADASGCVDQADYQLVGANYGTVPGVDPRADLNGDGVVNYADLTIVIQNWGEGC